jgi:hypothetical protein
MHEPSVMVQPFFHCFAVAFSILLTGLASAEDKIASRLEKAREAYREKIDGLETQVQAKIDAAKAQATKLGNKTILDALERDEKLFQEVGSIPFMIATPELIEKRNQARQGLLVALNKAVSDYTKTKNRFSADGIERELQATRDRFAQAATAGITGTGEFRLVHLVSGLCMAADPQTNRLSLLPSSKATSHRWKINRRSDTGPYTLENVKTGLLVNVPNNSKQENLALILYGKQEWTQNEIWAIRGEGSVVQFLSQNQLALSVASPSPNSEIVQVTPKLSPEQFWIVERLSD